MSFKEAQGNTSVDGLPKNYSSHPPLTLNIDEFVAGFIGGNPVRTTGVAEPDLRTGFVEYINLIVS